MLNCMYSLATTLSAPEAEQLLRQTVQLHEKIHGGDDRKTFKSMKALVAVLQETGKHEEAEELHRQRSQRKANRKLGPQSHTQSS